jgi:protein ImuB
MTIDPRAVAVGSPIALYACLLARQSPDSSITKSPNPAITKSLNLLPVARDFSPRVVQVGEGEVLIDVSGLGRLIGEPPAIARELVRALTELGLEADVAIACTQTAARLLARSGGQDGPESQVATGDPAAAIAGLPVTRLQAIETLPPAMNVRDRARPFETFERWGIRTLGALAALPAADLASRLGRRGQALQRLAAGRDPRPFVPDAATPRFLERLELEWPIDALEPLSFILARLLDPLAVALERADRGAAAVHVDLRLVDRSTHARVLQLPAAMRDPRVLRTLMLLDLESHPPSTAIDVVTIELDPAPARVTQFSLLERALPSPETLSTLTARLSALVGESRCGAAALVDTHRPGAFEMRCFGIDGAATAVPRAGAAERIERAVLRRQRPPPAIRVTAESGRPVFVAGARRGLPAGAIVQSAGPWRTSGAWWEGGDGSEGGPVPPKRSEGGWNHDEWDVELASGAVCRIFQDRLTRRWFLDGVYD